MFFDEVITTTRYLDDQKEQYKKSNPDLYQVLSKLQHMIEYGMRNEGINPVENVREAIYFLENLRVKKFLSEKTMGEIIFGKNRSALHPNHVPRYFQELSFDPDLIKALFPARPLTGNVEYVLNAVHQHLVQAYKHSWTYSYPLDETGQVMNNHIGNWQSQSMNIDPDNFSRVKLDMTRIGYVNEKKVPVNASDNEIRSTVRELVRATNYAPPDKEKIEKWITANGGQGNFEFFLMMLLDHSFSNEALTVASKTTSINYNVKEGQLYLDIDLRVNALSEPKNQDDLIFSDKNGTVMRAPIDQIFETQEFNYTGKRDKLPDPPPLMRANMSIRLDIEKNHITNENQVIPKVVKFEVTSFNQFLISPEKNNQEVLSKEAGKEKASSPGFKK